MLFGGEPVRVQSSVVRDAALGVDILDDVPPQFPLRDAVANLRVIEQIFDQERALPSK